MKNLTVSKMNKNIANGKNVEWTKHACKESALAGRVKKLAPKVNAIVKEMDLDPDAVTVEFENVKPSGEAMFDTIKIHGEDFSIAVEFHTATKASAGFVSMVIANQTENDAVECETWKELKSILSDYASYAQGGECPDCVNDPEDEDEEELTEVDEEPAEEEDEVDEAPAEEEEEELPFEDELEEPIDDED